MTEIEDAQQKKALQVFKGIYTVDSGQFTPSQLLNEISNLPAYKLSYENNQSVIERIRVPINEAVTVELITEATSSVSGGMSEDRPQFLFHFNIKPGQFPKIDVSSLNSGLIQPYPEKNVIQVTSFDGVYNEGTYDPGELLKDLTAVIEIVKAQEFPIAGVNSDEIDEYINKVLKAVVDHARKIRANKEAAKNDQ